MVDVQDMPESDSEEDDVVDDARENDGDGEEGDEIEGDAETGRESGKAEESRTFDEEDFQQEMADRLESLRIHRALGNDDPDASSSTPSDEESVSEHDSTSSTSSAGPPTTDFSTYARERKSHGRPRMTSKKLGEKAGVRSVVTLERERHARGTESKKGVGAGKVKGHKWKSNDKYLVGKSSGW